MLEMADKALGALGADGSSSLRREALVIRAEALALSDRAADAQAAMAAALEAWPAWAPAPDADPRVVASHRAALAARVAQRLPDALDPGPLPLPQPPSSDELLPPPQLFAPKRLVELDVDAAKRKDFRLVIGGGVAVLGGSSAERFDTGIQAALALGFQVTEMWRVFVATTLSLHDFADGVAVEAGYGRGLTTVAVTAGVGWSYPMVDKLDLLATVALGGGFFGVNQVTDEPGLAVQAAAGLRYWVGDLLALRVDVGPTVFVTVDGSVAAAAHLNVLGRAETRF
jgi:hypothetical protein